MVSIQKNISLLPFNTFHIDETARYLCQVTTREQLIEIINNPLFRQEKHLILGGGSNILFSCYFSGLIIKAEIKGIRKEKETIDKIWIKVYSGEKWSHFVTYAISNHWGGIENLSLIPGTVGATPIQNIGAYGVEVKNVIDTVEAVNLTSGEIHTFSNTECQFGYRDSIFKQNLQGQFFILSVTLILTKRNHVINTEYGPIRDVLKKNCIKEITIQAISKAITQIRRYKLPNPKIMGNAGSFFKNPIIPQKDYKTLCVGNNKIPCYIVNNKFVKIPAGWLIEQCGWKGKKRGSVVIHTNQALILVNYGGGSGKEIMSLAHDIQYSIFQKFKIQLVPEVTIVG